MIRWASSAGMGSQLSAATPQSMCTSALEAAEQALLGGRGRIGASGSELAELTGPGGAAGRIWQPVTTGGRVSSTSTFWTAVDSFPELSRAVQVRTSR